MHTDKFSSVIECLAQQGDRWCLDAPESWQQGRTLFGGMTVALCFEAVARSHGPLPPLRSAQINFVAPSANPLSVTSELLRQGKSVTLIESRLWSREDLAATCLFTFGAARASALSGRNLPPPALIAPEDCPAFVDSPIMPAFLSHFELRALSGAAPFSGSTETDLFVWVRHKDRQANGLLPLLAIADVLPPAAFMHYPGPAPGSSISWMFNLLEPEPDTRDGWWLLHCGMENMRDGYSSQKMHIWSADGTPVLAGRQCVAIFA